jgi:uncharacterized protein YlzI (FlbEa/FlbD family)
MMIVLTRLNGSTFAVNPDLIERVQETPDTSVVLVDGATYIVTESTAEIIDRITDYRARVISLASRFSDDEQPTAPRLGLIDGDGPRGSRKGGR